MAEGWIFFFYRAPKQPSSARVTAWRRLHRLGAVFLGPSACVLPARHHVGHKLDQIAAGLGAAGGSSEIYRVEQLSAESAERLEGLYSAARDSEYDEVIERAQAVIDELDLEAARQKFTFAEVEENEADLAKLRRWAGRIRWRDVFGASRREAAQAAVRAAQERLDSFARIAMDRDSEPVEVHPDPVDAVD